MNYRALISLSWAACATLTGCNQRQEPQQNAAPSSGIHREYFDASVRPQDDLYRYINGKWLDSTEIPADKARYGAFYELTERTEQQLRAIVEQLAADNRTAVGSDAQKIRDLYRSFMDEQAIEQRGATPLQSEFANIDAVRSVQELPKLFAHLAELAVSTPFAPYVHQDNRDSTRYAFDLYQSGLGLPDRDYYLKDGEDGTYKKARQAYRAHIEKMLGMSGDSQARRHAEDILDFETALAKVQWDRVTNRDPVKTYNKFTLAELPAVMRNYDWPAYLQAAGVAGKIDYVLVSQPTYLNGLGKLLTSQPLAIWKTYLKWRLLSEYAPYLSKTYVDENFAFFGTVLRGIPENRPRWKRGIDLVQNLIGEGLGKFYVAKHFPPQNKQRMEALVGNLMTAYRQSIDGLDWMADDTKREAQAKLAKFNSKIGYPAKWRDYSTLTIDAQDLAGNVMRAQRFEYWRNINKLGKLIDREEWLMTPQTINAYYNPEMNEIVFPAAILQPPFFDVNADDAVNYGAIGAVIGHEISHGFDDQGSQYDGDGNLRDWWTKEDHEKFTAKTQVLVAQYSAYEPVSGYHINGELTLGENIADNSGLAIAQKAYRLSLAGRTAPVLDGMSGEQRFFTGWAQAWREKAREQEAIRLLTIDPHSPARFRAIGAAMNQNAFHEAFEVRPGDKMYLAPEQRVSIW